jgi:hypothetical protein
MHLHTRFDQVFLDKGRNGGYAVSSRDGWELRVLFVRTVGEKSVFLASNHSRADGMIT